jgi:hypothetical protein
MNCGIFAIGEHTTGRTLLQKRYLIDRLAAVAIAASFDAADFQIPAATIVFGTV